MTNSVPFVPSAAIDVAMGMGERRALSHASRSGSFAGELARAQFALIGSPEQPERLTDLDVPLSIPEFDEQDAASVTPVHLVADLNGNLLVATHAGDLMEAFAAKGLPQDVVRVDDAPGTVGDAVGPRPNVDSPPITSRDLAPQSDEQGVSAADKWSVGAPRLVTQMSSRATAADQSAPTRELKAAVTSGVIGLHARVHALYTDPDELPLQNPSGLRRHSSSDGAGSADSLDLEVHSRSDMAKLRRLVGHVGDALDLRAEVKGAVLTATDRLAPAAPSATTVHGEAGADHSALENPGEANANRGAATDHVGARAESIRHASQDRPAPHFFAREIDRGASIVRDPSGRGADHGAPASNRIASRSILRHVPWLGADAGESSVAGDMGESSMDALPSEPALRTTGREHAPRPDPLQSRGEARLVERPWTSMRDMSGEEIADRGTASYNRSPVDTSERMFDPGPMNDEVSHVSSPSRETDAIRQLPGGSGAEPARPRSVPPEAIQQMVRKVEVDASELVSNLRLRLAPEKLGALDVRLAVEDGNLSARFFAQSEQVRALIESALPELRQQLEEQGLSVSQLDVSVGERSDNGSEDARERSQDAPTRRAQTPAATSSDVADRESPSISSVDLLV